MSLILPVIHPKIGGPGFSEPEWEIVSATKTTGTTFAEENPLPTDVAQQVQFLTSKSLLFHDGDLLVRAMSNYNAASPPPTITTGTYPTLLRNTGSSWTELCDEYSFTANPSTTIQGYSAATVWEDDIYMAVILRPYDSVSSRYNAGIDRLQIFRWDTGTTWTQLTNASYSVAPVLSGYYTRTPQNGVFFELNTELHFAWNERSATSTSFSAIQGDRFVIASWDGTAWTRLDEENFLAQDQSDWLETVEIIGDSVFFQEEFNVYSYTVAGGFGPQIIAESNVYPRWAQTTGDGNQYRLIGHNLAFGQFASQPGFIFGRYKFNSPASFTEALNYFYVSRWTGTINPINGQGTFDLTRFDKPQAGTGAVFQDFQAHAGSEYLLIGGPGTGMTTSEEGIWLYKRTGSEWEVLGNADVEGGSLRPSKTKFGTASIDLSSSSPKLYFIDGDPHILYYETKNESGVLGSRLIIARYA